MISYAPPVFSDYMTAALVCVGILVVVGAVCVGTAIEDDGRPVAWAIAFLIFIAVIIAAIILAHHAAWVDYRRRTLT